MVLGGGLPAGKKMNGLGISVDDLMEGRGDWQNIPVRDLGYWNYSFA